MTAVRPGDQPGDTMRAKVSFTVTTHWTRPRGEPGFTRLASKRLGLGTAIDWILAELPDDALTVVSPNGDGIDSVIIAIDWTRVPAEIRDGRP